MLRLIMMRTAEVVTIEDSDVTMRIIPQLSKSELS